MAVAMNYIRTDLKIVQHGIRHVENTISLTIGKLWPGPEEIQSKMTR